VTAPVVASAAPLPAQAERTGELEAKTTTFVRPELDEESIITTPSTPAASAHVTPPVTVVEGPRTALAVADLMTVQHPTDTTARVTAVPRTLITETPTAAPVASTTASVSASSTLVGTPPPPAAPPTPATSEPSILVQDLQAVHTAASAAVQKSTSFAKPPADAASSSRELEISQTRKDAVAFSDDEEAFFKRAESHSVMHPKFDSFDDLDEGYEAPKFWDRVFGRKKPPPK
jgi:hypothetical protein